MVVEHFSYGAELARRYDGCHDPDSIEIGACPDDSEPDTAVPAVLTVMATEQDVVATPEAA